VAVFSSQDCAPSALPFEAYDNKALVVYDKGEGDPLAVRLACLWARWVVRRQLSSGGDDLDKAHVEAQIEGARRALQRISTVRRCLSTAGKKIDEAGGQVTDLEAEVREALDAISDEIAPKD
jgi:hypothetical protein